MYICIYVCIHIIHTSVPRVREGAEESGRASAEPARRARGSSFDVFQTEPTQRGLGTKNAANSEWRHNVKHVILRETIFNNRCAKSRILTCGGSVWRPPTVDRSLVRSPHWIREPFGGILTQL